MAYTLGVGTTVVDFTPVTPCFDECRCRLHSKEVCGVCGCDWFRFTSEGRLECGFCNGPVADFIYDL